MSSDWNGSCSELSIQNRNLTSELWMLNLDNWVYVIAGIIAIFNLIGFTWHGLVIASIFMFKLHKKPTFVLLLNLVAVNILWCVHMGPADVVNLGFGEFVFGRSNYERCFCCKLFVMLQNVCTSVSAMLLGLMGLERLVYIKWPLWYGKIVNLRILLVLVAVIWLVCTLVHFPVFLDFGEVRIFEFSSCRLDFPRSKDYLGLSGTLLLSIAFFIAACNVWILLIIYKNRKAKLDRELKYANYENVAEFHENTKGAKKQYCRDQLMVTKAFGGIIMFNVIYIVCSLILWPIAVTSEGRKLEIWALVMHWSNYVHLVANPMLETCFVPKGRQLVWRVFCSCRKKATQQKLNVEVELI